MIEPGTMNQPTSASWSEGQAATSPSAATAPFPQPPPVEPEKGLGTAKWGMISFLLSEVAFFSTLISAYITFLGRDTIGPTPAEALALPLVIVNTILLLSSSATIHLAEKQLHRGAQSAFCVWWTATLLLGVAFLVGTGIEWDELITKHHLTISRNLFGTGYYTLVGFHAFHVTGGVVALGIVLVLALRRQLSARNTLAAEMVSWYWHFVDVVWVVVFAVVYGIGR